MFAEDPRRRSRWMMRVLEWSDPRARYPNLWHDGMPRQLLAFDTVGSRLRLGDLIAIYSPQTQKHAERSARYAGISRVSGLRRAQHDPSLVWIDLDTAHRFNPPLDLGEEPRRVFLCCDPGWPARDVSLCRRVLDAAVRSGWRPERDEREDAPADVPPVPSEEHALEVVVATVAAVSAGPAVLQAEAAVMELEARSEPLAEPRRTARVEPRGKLFAGIDLSGDMRDPKDATWLAVVELSGERLRVVRLEPTGRVGLQSRLRDADADLQRVLAFGLDFPFGLPIAFAETLLGGPFPEEGWWALARRLERMSRPEYLIALQDFRDANGEQKRLTDEQAHAHSPLHRIHPDLGATAYHGIRMIAEERSRYAIRPFESAKGRLLLEVYPGEALRRLGSTAVEDEGEPRGPILSLLEAAAELPVELEGPLRRRCLEKRAALDAVVAARCAAMAVATGEADRGVEELAPGRAERVRREGWIYGL